MRLRKLLVFVGLPHSGKSTRARGTMGAAIVNRDAIRLSVHGSVFRQESETIVTMIEEHMVRSLMLSQTECIAIDSTNTIPAFRNKWRLLAKANNYDIEFICLRAPKDICIERALIAGRSDLIPIIEKMAEYFTFPPTHTNIEDNLILEATPF